MTLSKSELERGIKLAGEARDDQEDAFKYRAFIAWADNPQRVTEIIEELVRLRKAVSAFELHGTDDCRNWDSCGGRITLFHLNDRECITCSNSRTINAAKGNPNAVE